GIPGSVCLSRSWKKSRPADLSRRKFLQYCHGASLAFLPAGIPLRSFFPFASQDKPDGPEEFQLHPEYRLKRGMDALLRKVPAGLDEFVTEKYQDRIAAIFTEWSSQLLQASQDTAALGKVMAPGFLGNSLKAGRLKTVNDSASIKVWQVQYPAEPTLGAEKFLSELRSSLDGFAKLTTAEFQVIRIHAEPSPSAAIGGSTSLATVVRFELVGAGTGFHREQRIGHWELRWEMSPSGEMRLQKWRALDEQRGRALVPVFQDIASNAFGNNP